MRQLTILGSRRLTHCRVGWAVALWLMGLLAFAPAWAQSPVPALSGHVVDITATLSAQAQQAMEAKLAAFERQRGTQIVVLMVPTTQPEDIASYANRVANSWKIGRRDVGDGLLLIVALNDRKVRIEVAKTLEGTIPDLAAMRVIDTAITPAFKQADYLGGLNAGVDQLMAHVAGEKLPLPTPPKERSSDGFRWMDSLVFLFFVVPVVGAVARRMLGVLPGAVATGGLMGFVAYLVTASLVLAVPAALLAMVLTLVSGASGAVKAQGWRRGGGGPGGWSAGGGGLGGGSVGGMRSGGGGDFGGGGASGRW